MKKKKTKRMHGRVQKIIKPSGGEPEKAQIAIDEADDLYKEVRVENKLTDENGVERRLKEGAEVDISIEADSDATLKKPPRT